MTSQDTKTDTQQDASTVHVDTPQDTKQDNAKTPRQTRKPHDNSRKVSVLASDPVSDQTSETPMPTPAHLDKAEQILQVAELLASGKSVRQVLNETGYSKSLVEQVSKNISRERPDSSRSARTDYLNKPYELAVESQQKEEKQSWLSDKIKSMVEDALMLSLQVQVYRDVLGLGAKNNGGDLYEKLLLTKAASNQSMSAQDLISFAAELKTLFAQQPQQPDNFLEKIEAIERLKDGALEKFAALQDKARQQVQSQQTKSLAEDLITKGADIAQKIFTAPKTPQSLPGLPPPTQPTPSPTAIMTEPVEVENLALPPRPDDSAVGYTNINSPFHANAKGGEKQ